MLNKNEIHSHVEKAVKHFADYGLNANFEDVKFYFNHHNLVVDETLLKYVHGTRFQ